MAGNFAMSGTAQKLALFQAKTIGPDQSTIPALQGLSLNLPKPVALPPITIAQPQFNAPTPKAPFSPNPSSALGNVLDPFVKGAKELGQNVLNYKLAIAQIKQVGAETKLLKQTDKSGGSTQPSFGVSTGGSSPPVNPTQSGGFSGTTLLLIGAGVVVLFLVARH